MTLPLEHLSASSLNLFARCPRQWQEKYILGHRQPTSDAMAMGKLAHALLADALVGVPPSQSTWDEALADDPDYVPSPSVFPDAERMALAYFEEYGRYLDVVDTEVEFLHEIKGVDIPVLGYVDIECTDRLIDVKTTGYLSPRSVRLNSEWKLQANIYQMNRPKPAEFHVITKAKNNPILVPTDPDHFLYVAPPPVHETENWVRQTYEVMCFYYERWGTDEWPGGRTHDWAGKYCKVENCCQV